jgi:hypothetical protein
MLTLPTNSAVRKGIPLWRGLLMYFPAALAGVALHSRKGNDKHNPGEELHHARGKSSDHGDCILRHLTDIADIEAAYNRPDTAVSPADVLLDEVNALAWRALAFAQEMHEKYAGAPMAPAARPARLADLVRPVDMTKFDGLKDGDEFEFRNTCGTAMARRVVGQSVYDGAFRMTCVPGTPGREVAYPYERSFIRYTKKVPR